MKYCPTCKQEKEISNFTKNKTNYDGLQDYCRTCKSIRDKKYYIGNKEIHKTRVKVYINKKRLRVWNYLLSHPCIDCGENNPVVLEFDHIGNDKLFAVAAMVTIYSWKNLEKEINKCEIRCANCHRIKTAKEKGWYQFLNNENSGPVAQR